ncbi:MAG: acyl transferase [Chitinophagaceae bacterium]|nr:acyl transferase [Chitinophagaceae bacterium]
MKDIVNNIFSVESHNFSGLALRIFQLQYHSNVVYKAWVDALGIDTFSVTTINEIPFLPVSFFKSHEVVAEILPAEQIFTSSGTSQTINSRHFVTDVSIYEQSFFKGFEHFYGAVTDWCIICLLPSYLERHGSSLVYMVDHLIKATHNADSGFYLYNFDKLALLIQQQEARKQKTMIIGVTFALLDFAMAYPMRLQYTTIVETGGMKGRKREMIRAEVHQVLKENFELKNIHSEYGMTELLSQAYSKGNGIFKTLPWMKVFARDEDDPLQVHDTGKGLLNIIDLANINSCSFIATDDVALIYEDNSFEVIGRMDASDLRGCSLLVAAN